MSDYAVSFIDVCPRAAKPILRMEVRVFEFAQRQPRRGRRGAKTPSVPEAWVISVEESEHHLSVPLVDTWTPDTLRAIWHELDAYIPAHRLTEAAATVSVDDQKRRPNVRLGVEARGWRAEICPNFHRSELRRENFLTTEEYQLALTREEIGIYAHDFTEPMLAVLRELADRSPFLLAEIENPLQRQSVRVPKARRNAHEQGDGQ